MALIQCPHCGKSVSDTAEKCIHCGKNLIYSEKEKQKEKFVNYEDLNQSEQSELKKEFYNIYPQYKKYEDKDAMYKKINKISWIITIIGFIFILPIFFADEAEFVLTLSLIGYITITVSQLVDISSIFFIRANKKKTLLATKKYQKWLKEKKGITYTVTFIGKDKKWKKYFDEINVDVEG